MDGKQTKQTKLITNEISNLTNTLKTKHITDRQVSYIINTVIIPILEFHIHNIILTQTTCNKILSSYLSIAKYKSNLATTIVLYLIIISIVLKYLGHSTPISYF